MQTRAADRKGQQRVRSSFNPAAATKQCIIINLAYHTSKMIESPVTEVIFPVTHFQVAPAEPGCEIVQPMMAVAWRGLKA